MLLKIVTPERIVVDDEVDAFYGQTEDGMIGILPKHIPLISTLKIGAMSYTKGGTKHPISVMGGLLETDGKQVTVLTDAAELTSEIDVLRAQHAKERAEAELKNKRDQRDTAEAQLALARAMVRLKIAGK